MADKPMSKSELIKAVADNTGISQKEAGTVLDAALDTISDTLKNRGKVALAGFGTFEAKTRAARDGRNPSTGKPIKIAEKTSAAFKPASVLKDI